MATVTKPEPAGLEAAAVRRALADAVERLRALELPVEAWAMREIALTGLQALATALFTDAHSEAGNPGALAGLVADEIGRIAQLLAASETGTGQVRTPEPATGRWGR